MQKVYESHEVAYQKLKKHGAISWNEMYSKEKGEAIDHEGVSRKNFINDVLSQTWAPKSGKVLEIGSGSGHLLRWICQKGYQGTGIEISKTAVELAKEQSKDSNVSFINADFCYSESFKENDFDLIVDGHCFHCIVEEKDRRLFLEQAKKYLKSNGVFILHSTCSPINKKAFKETHKTQKFIKNILYVPYEVELEGSKKFGDKLYMAQRNFDHWERILKLVKSIGFDIKIFRYEQWEVYSSIYIACVKK